MAQIIRPNDGSSSSSSSSAGRRKPSEQCPYAGTYGGYIIEDPVKPSSKSKIYAALAVMVVTLIIIAVIAIAASN